jgi:hypothetical protein
MKENQEIVVFTTKDKKIVLDVFIDKDSVWLNQYQLSELFLIDRTSILRHIRNIYKTGELSQKSTCANITQVQKSQLPIFPR